MPRRRYQAFDRDARRLRAPHRVETRLNEVERHPLRFGPGSRSGVGIGRVVDTFEVSGRRQSREPFPVESNSAAGAHRARVDSRSRPPRHSVTPVLCCVVDKVEAAFRLEIGRQCRLALAIGSHEFASGRRQSREPFSVESNWRPRRTGRKSTVGRALPRTILCGGYMAIQPWPAKVRAVRVDGMVGL